MKYWCWCRKQPQRESSLIAEGLVSGGLQGFNYLVLKWTPKSLSLICLIKRLLRSWIHIIFQFNSMLLPNKSSTSFEFQYFSKKIVELSKVKKELQKVLKLTHAKQKMPFLSINIQQDYHRTRPMWSQAAIPPIPNTPTKLTWEVSGCQFCFSPALFLSVVMFNRVEISTLAKVI